MRLRALIFDVDGTLADTEDAHRRAFNGAFSDQGLDWNWSRPLYADLLATTGGKERLSAYIDSLPVDPAEGARLEQLIPAIHARKTELYTGMVESGEVTLRDGVARLIEEALDAGVRLAIATTTTYANIEALLRVNLGAHAITRFAAIGAADHARRKKPAPDIYLHVLRDLDLPARDCVAFEDSFNGVAAAKGASLFTVVTPSYWTRGEDFSAADLVLPTLGSPARPLTGRAAALVGNFMLGVREIDRQLSDNDRAQPAHGGHHAGGRP